MSEPDSPGDESGVVTKLSSRSVAETASLFTNLLVSKGLKIFAVIDQGAEARQAGLKLRETILVIFGNPASGTPVMVASPLSALDLPLKVLVWSDESGGSDGAGGSGGQTKVSYISPDALASRHHLSTEVAANLRGIDALTDELVAR
jgi:uncharacterized protein (DUF302 family)